MLLLVLIFVMVSFNTTSPRFRHCSDIVYPQLEVAASVDRSYMANL